jgi:hypothetical protein
MVTDSTQLKDKKTLLTVDWDFFIWNGLEAEEDYEFLVNNKMIPAWLFFDWGVSEGMSAETMDESWESRKDQWTNAELEFEKEFNIRTDRGCTDPKDFVKTIRKNLKIVEPNSFYSDAHSLAYILLGETYESCGNEPLHVLMFDAHHDMGYWKEHINRQIKEGFSMSDTWLFHGINNGLVDSVELVYPNWRGKHEWTESLGNSHMELVEKNVTVYTWDEWNCMKHHDIDVQAFHVARSSHWTPPWLDRSFNRFIKSLYLSYMDCAEMLYDIPYAYDSHILRKWNASNTTKRKCIPKKKHV